MHDKPRRADQAAEGRHTTRHEDAQDRRSVLFRVLALHPAHLTTAELVREIGAGAEGFEETDDIERAIRDLVGAGLLNRIGAVIAPTRAALVFNALDRD
jgi:hypothetical protein